MAIEQEFCNIPNGFCFELQLYHEAKLVEFRHFNFNHTEFNNLIQINKAQDDHDIVLRQKKQQLNLLIIPKETRQINQTSFEIQVFNSTLGFADGYNYKFDANETTILKADYHQYFA